MCLQFLFLFNFSNTISIINSCSYFKARWNTNHLTSLMWWVFFKVIQEKVRFTYHTIFMSPKGTSLLFRSISIWLYCCNLYHITTLKNWCLNKPPMETKLSTFSVGQSTISQPFTISRLCLKKHIYFKMC